MSQLSKIWQSCINNPVKTIIIAAVFVRLLIFFLYGHITEYPDSEDYRKLAVRLMNFDLEGYEGERPPGYPLLMCFAGMSDLVVVFFQLVMGVCTLVFAYKTLLVLEIDKRLALIATLFGVSYLPAVFFEFAILTETFTLLVITLIFYLFLGIIKGRKTRGRRYIWISLLCCYLVFIKVFYINLAVILFVLLVWHNRKSLKSGFKKYIMVLLMPLFFFLGWSYVNKLNTGYFVSSTFYGFNLAQNCVRFAGNTTPEYQEIGDIYVKYRSDTIRNREIAMTIWQAYPELKATTGLSFPDLSKELYDYSIATIKKNPVDYLGQVFISWRDFWKTSLYWEAYNFAVPESMDIVMYVNYGERIVLQLIKILFVLLIPYNIIIACRKRKMKPEAFISLIVLTASLLQAFATYGTNSRFSFPFEILMVTSVLLNMLQYYHRKKVIIRSN
ncbi:glycosyltransferase family 39 protein [Prevotella sp. 10(H)]|uniref:glycosyltransferase family 39 protein n=1 Tax=Prevotella sp. 10(H) TaxID=1158294 RepID=UPI00055C9428|nr:glycosyltransferase family 39 protein [Prevotella sp. 10(H)]